MKLYERTQWLNHDGRKLLENAIVVPAIRRTLGDLVKATPPGCKWLLGGALAVGVYSKSRTTMDVDILVSDKDADTLARSAQLKFGPPEINNMKHRETGVKVDFVTPTTVSVPKRFFDAAFAGAELHKIGRSEVAVLSPTWLVVFKLARFSRQDQADIESVLRNCGPVDVEMLGLPGEWIQRYHRIADELFA